MSCKKRPPFTFERRWVPELRDKVLFVYRIRSSVCTGQKLVHHHLPDGTFEIVFDLEGEIVHGGAGDDHRPRAFLSGMFGQMFNMTYEGSFDAVGAVVRPGFVREFADLPVGDLSSTLIPLDILWGSEVERNLDQLIDLKGHMDPLQSLVNILSKSQSRAKIKPDHQVLFAVNAIQSTRGKISVNDLASSVKMSDRSLRRRFTAFMGIPPKKYATLVRVNAFFKDRKMQANQNTLVESAERAGYYDLSHLHRDLNQFAGGIINTKQLMTDNTNHELFVSSKPITQLE